MPCLISNLGNAMYKPFAILLLLAFIACKPKNKPAASTAKTDTIIPLRDTAILPYTAPDHLRDSLEWRHKLDSFYAIKPIAIYAPAKHGYYYNTLVADVIDTASVTTTPLVFADTTITKLDKKGDNIIYQQHILKNNRFKVEVIATGKNLEDRRQIIINGHKLRYGIELDISLSGTQFADRIDIDPTECSLMTFGTKEYLFLKGYIEMCTGMACGVSYYLLYDPAIKKAMILEQFRCDFNKGYDKKNNTLVFIDMNSFNEHMPEYQCYMTTGKLYRFTHTGKIKPVYDKTGKPISFTAWCRNLDSPVYVIKGNFIRSN
ncbi:hypothetical protein ABIE54_006408 [Chitinophagaceae bacterium OAS944]